MPKMILHSRYEGETQAGKKSLVHVYKEGGSLFIGEGASRIAIHHGFGSIETKIERECGLQNVRLIEVPYSPVN